MNDADLPPGWKRGSLESRGLIRGFDDHDGSIAAELSELAYLDDQHDVPGDDVAVVFTTDAAGRVVAEQVPVQRGGR